MTRRETNDLRSFQDGTSQRSRNLAALDPQSITIDGRSDADLLAFVQKLTQHLIFTETDAAFDGPAATAPPQHWEKFATPPSGLALSTADMATYIDHPERFSGEAADWLGRPHFALLLTCIALLRHLRNQQNGIARRHLDHYYRDQLGMAPLLARPDRVAVLFRLARGAQEVLLPAGTPLKAGKDSRGVNREYRTEDELVIRRTRVSELRTVFVDRRITTLQSLCRVARTADEQMASFDQALRLALGTPDPGDPVPPWTHSEVPSGAVSAEINATFLAGCKERLAVCDAKLHMLHEELRELLRLYRRRTDKGSDKEWAAINRLMGVTPPLEKPSDRDFLANLERRVGFLDFERDGLSQVSSVDDLYRYRGEKLVRAYIETELLELADTNAADAKTSAFNNFSALMAIKQRIDAEWQEIHRLLEQAGRKARPADPAWRLKGIEPTDFSAMLKAALSFGGNWPTGDQGVEALMAYDRELRLLEEHLFMPVERIQLAVSAAASVVSAPPKVLGQAEWDRLLTILSDAHIERFHARGRENLDALRMKVQGAGPDGPYVFDGVLSSTLTGLSLIPPGGADSPWSWETARAELARHLATGEMAVLDGFRQQLQDPGVAPRRFSWNDALGVLEFAQRRIGKVPDPQLRAMEWRNLYAAADARAQGLDSGRWATFGRRPLRTEAESPEANVGFALLSPLLSMSQGERTIKLKMDFAEEGFDRTAFLKHLAEGMETSSSFTECCNDKLIVRVSGAKGWIEFGIKQATLYGQTSEKPALELTIEAKVSDDPFTSSEGESSPMLQVLLKPKLESEGSVLITTGAFEPLRLEAVHLQVAVEGLSELVLQQEDRRLDAKKPFEPFGPQPTVGSRFYVSHPELIRNRLNSLTFHLQWTGLSKLLSDQYLNYRSNPSAADFKVRIDLMDQQRSLKLGLEPSETVTLPQEGGVEPSLFGADSSIDSTANKDIKIIADDDAYCARPDLQPGDDLRQDSRVWCWTLSPMDFGHSRYPALAATKGQQLAVALASTTPPNGVSAETYRVDPPYTPKLKGLTVDYTTSISIELLPQAPPTGSELLHVHPFGLSRILAEPAPSPPPTLFPPYTAAGELYIGLADAALPQRLSLLVQLAEGTSDPDLEPGTLRWQILDGERWTDLTVRRDDTAGFLHSGLVVLDLPPAAPSRRLPSSLQWLRVTIDRDPTSVCYCVDLHAQALMATFHDQGNADEHYASPLPPGSLKVLLTPDARIAAIDQPYSSFGGRPVEPDRELDRRVSEGLRHKQRALAAWDYERLVLEEFGSRIHKVKCIAGSGNGQVDVIVIPDLRGALPADALAPKAPANLLEAIRHFLQSRAPGTATVRVSNAKFQQVRIRLGVRFREGQEEGFSKQRLTEDLVRFLSPWAYDEGAEIRIGDTVYATSIVEFVDRLAYVDYVAQIHLFLLDGSGNSIQDKDGLGAAITAQAPDIVLVSSRQHQIDIISALGYDARSFGGIGYMQIEFDFIVAPAPAVAPAPT